ncbi:MAG TPA: hypothetical protein VE862_02570 [Candidatus Acidoferrum sp.]|nr:hypothetical protein [Candidatus Acidoferrum sp.]
MNFKTIYRLAIYGTLGIALCVALAHLVGFLDFRIFVDYMTVLLGSAAILLAIRLEELVKEMRTGEVNEKISMIYGYGLNMRHAMPRLSQSDCEYYAERMHHDLTAMIPIKDEIKKDLKEELKKAEVVLLDAMRESKFDDEAQQRISEDFDKLLR